MMTDDDYIRAAVELADGWEFIKQRGESHRIDNPDFGGYPVTLTNMPKTWLDALAAQLVRQVDALERYDWFCDHRVAAVVSPVKFGKFGSPQFIGESHGPDRTMNTIKSIVDSGVLKPIALVDKKVHNEE